MTRHTINHAADRVKFGNSSCLCKNCYMFIEGLGIWISNSEIDASYTEDDAIRDFWEDWDLYGKKYLKELELIGNEVY